MAVIHARYLYLVVMALFAARSVTTASPAERGPVASSPPVSLAEAIDRWVTLLERDDLKSAQ